MKVLTFGWDFPPVRNGGLGVACYGLTRELSSDDIDIIFVLPKHQPVSGTPRFLFADRSARVTVREVMSGLQPYHSSTNIVESIVGVNSDGSQKRVQRSIIEEVYRFARAGAEIAMTEEHDIIHAHDWSSYLAGVAAKQVSGKPLILHVHATSFDQAASHNVDPAMYDIELTGFNQADVIVAVSQFTKNIIVEKHGIPAEKVQVIHNGCDTHEPVRHPPALKELKEQGKRIVLYHGRITIQKGVDYFVRAAKRVVEYDPNVVFVISGWGDMSSQIMEQVGREGLSNHVLFAGALWEDDRDRMYQTADLVVMPSVSEPFGLVPLEAIQHGTPSLISKQSGVAEVLTHVLKVDFWDVDDMANKIIATLRYPILQSQLQTEGRKEINKLSWSHAAEKVRRLYQSLLQWSRV